MNVKISFIFPNNILLLNNTFIRHFMKKCIIQNNLNFDCNYSKI